jgi:hypothetical protein
LFYLMCKRISSYIARGVCWSVEPFGVGALALSGSFGFENCDETLKSHFGGWFCNCVFEFAAGITSRCVAPPTEAAPHTWRPAYSPPFSARITPLHALLVPRLVNSTPCVGGRLVKQTPGSRLKGQHVEPSPVCSRRRRCSVLGHARAMRRPGAQVTSRFMGHGPGLVRCVEPRAPMVVGDHCVFPTCMQ